MIPGRQYTPADVLRMARRRAPVMAAVFATAAIVAAAVVAGIPKQYRAEAVILISAQQVPDDFMPASAPVRREEQLRTVSQRLLSRTTLSAVISEFNLYPVARATQGLDAAIKDMHDDVNLDFGDGNAFVVSYVASDAHLAAQVTDKLSRLIMEGHAKTRTDFAEQMNRFLDAQLVGIRSQLTEQERRLDAYRSQHGGTLPVQLQANVSALAGAQLQLQSLMQTINADRDRLDLLRRLPAAAAAGTDRQTAEADSLSARLEEARATLSTMRQRLTAEHPDIAAQQRYIGDLERELARRPAAAPGRPPDAPVATADPDGEISSLNRRIAEKETERQRLVHTIADLQARVDTAPAHEAEFAILNRDYETLQKLYSSLLTKAEESKIAASLEHGQVDQQFRLLDPARVPDRPFRPNRLRLLTFGLLGALALAVVVGAVLEARDASVHDDVDLRFVSNVRLIGTVGEVVTENGRRRRAAAVLLVVSLVVTAAGWMWWWRR